MKMNYIIAIIITLLSVFMMVTTNEKILIFGMIVIISLTVYYNNIKYHDFIGLIPILLSCGALVSSPVKLLKYITL